MEETILARTQELRQLVDAVLAKYGIDDLQLSIDIVTSVTSMWVEQSRGLSPAEAKEKVKSALIKGGAGQLERDRIASAFKVKAQINVSEEMLEFAYDRYRVDGQDVDVFIDWWIKNAGPAQYWTERRMRMLWPQAFVKKPQQPQLELEVRGYGAKPTDDSS